MSPKTAVLSDLTPLDLRRSDGKKIARSHVAEIHQCREAIMVQELKRIEYRRGMLEKGMKPDGLPIKVWRGAKIHPDVRAAVNAENLVNLGGVYGNKKAGDPVEYDNLKLVLTDKTIEITVYNRGIALFITDNERIRRIHRVLCMLD